MLNLNPMESTIIKLMIAFAIGVALCGMLFGYSFTHISGDHWYLATLLLSLAFIAALVLATLTPQAWLWVAGAMLTPTLTMNITCMSGVYAEGKGVEWAYLQVILLVSGVTLAGAFLGRCLGRSRFLANRQDNQPPSS